jgi:hypothetical protein
LQSIAQSVGPQGAHVVVLGVGHVGVHTGPQGAQEVAHVVPHDVVLQSVFGHVPHDGFGHVLHDGPHDGLGQVLQVLQARVVGAVLHVDVLHDEVAQVGAHEGVTHGIGQTTGQVVGVGQAVGQHPCDLLIALPKNSAKLSSFTGVVLQQSTVFVSFTTFVNKKSAFVGP